MRKQSIVASIALVAIGLAAAPAYAKGVDVQGVTNCSAGVSAKIKAGPRDPSLIKTNVQISDPGNAARTWTITVTDGAVSKTTTVTSAAVDVDFFTLDDPGADAVTMTATRAGATCSGSVTV